MNRKILIDVIGMLLIALVVVVGYKLSPLLLPKADVVVQPDPACNLQRQACSVKLPSGGSVKLAMGTRPVPMVKPFEVLVTTSGFAPARVEVDFAGIDMNMGLNRPELATRGGGRFAAQVTLPVCITGQMDWQATVLIDTGSERIAIPYRFSSGGTNKMSEGILAVIAGLLAALVLGLAIFWQPELEERPLPKAALAEGGDFTLQSADGPLALKDFRGKVVLLYFGYTYCPDICPTSLAATSAGLRLLTPDEQARVAMIFVSVDPKRDTLPRLKEYVEFFHPSILGTTDTQENIAAVARRYGVFYAEQKVETAGDGYVVDHSADTYVIAPDGKLAGRIAHATPPDLVAATIRKYLNQP